MSKALQESQQDLVDVCIETTTFCWYAFEHVTSAALKAAIGKALEDGTVLSLINSDGACLVVPWAKIYSVSSADVFEEIEHVPGESFLAFEERRTWGLLWEREDEFEDKEPAPVFQ